MFDDKRNSAYVSFEVYMHVTIIVTNSVQGNSPHQFVMSPCMTEDPEATCSKSPVNTKGGDVIIKTVDIHSSRGGQFSVAAKDASLLERISHKATKETRVLEPHEVFIELEELRYDSMESLEWKETARWIKFEEDVEQEVGRWGRPHVSALAFHSLVDLRKGLEKGS